MSHFFCYELLSTSPELNSHLWVDYRPWPEESAESVCFWIDGASGWSTTAIEIVTDDPADKSQSESAGVWGRIIADVLKLATAIAYRGLGTGYVILFGELNFDKQDKRVGQFPFVVDGQRHSIQTVDLLSSAMDTGFFEELMHPHETTPPAVLLQLLACETDEPIGFCMWSIELPE